MLPRYARVLAEFEINLRRERQLEGIADAKARGVYKDARHQNEKDHRSDRWSEKLQRLLPCRAS